MNSKVFKEDILMARQNDFTHNEHTKLYNLLRNVNILDAFIKEDESNIGLEVISLVIEKYLKKIKCDPDIIYIETSLFPERTRFYEKLVDFIYIKVNNPIDHIGRENVLKHILIGYNLVYNALHRTGNSIYYFPDFFLKPQNMEMVFSKYRRDCPYKYSKDIKNRRKERMDDIQKSISEIGQEMNGKSKSTYYPSIVKAYDNGIFEVKKFLKIEEKQKSKPYKECKEDIEINNSIFHELFAEKAFPDFNTSFMWSIPIIGSATQAEKHLVGQGAIFILIGYKLDNNVDISLKEKYTANIGRIISYLVKDLFISYLYTASKDMLKQALRYSLQSSISAIMGRNMSHNIGSHVMARISTGGIDGWTTNEKIDDIIKNLNDEKSKKDIIHWSKDIQFLSRYIQQRMDFIAQIATDWPTWTEPAYLMNDLMRWLLSQKHLLNNIAASEGLQVHSFVNDEKIGSKNISSKGSQTSVHKNGSITEKKMEIDEQENDGKNKSDAKKKPDDISFHVFIVPKNRWDNKDKVYGSVKERMNFLKPNTDDIESQGENKLKCIIHSTKDCESCDTCCSTLLFTPPSGQAESKTDEDILLAIPGGIIGYHAFYIILENIIRNGAKHDYTRRKQEVDNHFDLVIEVLYDPEEEIAIQTQIGDEKKKIPAFLFRIYNNTSKIENGIDNSMNNLLKTSIITATGELNKGNWGLSEMKIAAGFLQQRDIAHIGDGKERVTGERTDNFKTLGEDKNGSDTIIRAVESPIGTLGYEFYIPKPRTVSIVCSEGKEEAVNGR
jgi:hypothetical protein